MSVSQKQILYINLQLNHYLATIDQYKAIFDQPDQSKLLLPDF